MNPITENYLEHHGIKGQRWGERRYQNPDGSLTALGKQRLSKGKYLNDDGTLNKRGHIKAQKHDGKIQAKRDKYVAKTRANALAKAQAAKKAKDDDVKNIEDIKKRTELNRLSNEELKERVTRIRLESEYKSYIQQPAMKKKQSVGKKIISDIADKAVSEIPNAVVNYGKQYLLGQLDKKLNPPSRINLKSIDVNNLNRYTDKQMSAIRNRVEQESKVSAYLRRR